jgi:hypothetical protein
MLDAGWDRWVRRAVVCVLLGAAASCGEAPETSGVVPTKVTPVRLVAMDDAEERSAWALFDRDTQVGFTPKLNLVGEAQVTLRLGSPRSLGYVKIYGSSAWELTASTPDGEPIPGLEKVKLDDGQPGWRIVRVTELVSTDQVILRFKPLSEQPGPPDRDG